MALITCSYFCSIALIFSSSCSSLWVGDIGVGVNGSSKTGIGVAGTAGTVGGTGIGVYSTQIAGFSR